MTGSDLIRACYRFRVSGRVQGVFFRQSTVAEARRLGVDGWVRNLADGDVDGIACGAEAALAQLRRWLEHGPPKARVSRVDWQPVDELPAAGFGVRAD